MAEDVPPDHVTVDKGDTNPDCTEDLKAETAPLITAPSAPDATNEAWIPSSPTDYRRLLYNIFAGVEAGL